MATDDLNASGDGAGYTSPDDLLALSLARGRTVSVAAREAGIDRRTVHRRLHEPEFRKRVEHFRRLLVEQAVCRLSDHMTAAASTLAKLMKSKNEAIALGACSRLLALGLTANEQRDLSARLEELERQAQRKRR